VLFEKEIEKVAKRNRIKAKKTKERKKEGDSSLSHSQASHII